MWGRSRASTYQGLACEGSDPRGGLRVHEGAVVVDHPRVGVSPAQKEEEGEVSRHREKEVMVYSPLEEVSSALRSKFEARPEAGLICFVAP